MQSKVGYNHDCSLYPERPVIEATVEVPVIATDDVNGSRDTRQKVWAN
jgi:hypothetical protein